VGGSVGFCLFVRLRSCGQGFGPGKRDLQGEKVNWAQRKKGKSFKEYGKDKLELSGRREFYSLKKEVLSNVPVAREKHCRKKESANSGGISRKEILGRPNLKRDLIRLRPRAPATAEQCGARAKVSQGKGAKK